MKRHHCLSILTVVMMLVHILPVAAAGEKDTVIVQFPEDRGLGNVLLFDEGTDVSNLIIREDLRFPARGKIKLRKGSQLVLELNYYGLARLDYLVKLKSEALVGLDLRHLSVTDQHLNQIIKISKLQRLQLDSTEVDDKGVLKLAQMPNLRFLSASRCQVTGKGIRTLAKFPRLEQAHMGHSALDDDCSDMDA